MKLEIYRLAHSPFCIAIERTLEALDVPFVRKEQNSADRGELLRLTHGAYYEVPVLVDDGQVIYETAGDSQDIAEHIDVRYAEGRLFPQASRGLQAILLHYLENEVEGVTFRLFDPFYVDSISDVAERGMIVRHKERKFGKGCVQEWRERHDELVASAVKLLKPFDQALESSPFLLGEAPVYADFLLFGILGNLTFGGFHEVPEELPRLREFQQRIAGFRYP
ncbi:MAG: glutathione S-transferase family protein [Luteolibacter sp.]